MYVVLVTGGIGSGKKTVCEYLAQKGATTLDLDAIAREEQENPVVLDQIRAEFGDDVIDEDGQIARSLLAARAFASRERADRLNAICWPPVMERVASYLVGGGCQPMAMGDLLLIEIPLLAEAPALLDLKDEVICVVAPEDMRLQRAVARGMCPEDVRNRMALQATDEQRIAISDTVIDNSSSLASLHAQLDAWYRDHTASRLF